MNNIIHNVYDCIIIGGGISGFYCALELQRKNPKWSIAILEKYKGIGGRTYTYKPRDFPGIQWERGGCCSSLHRSAQPNKISSGIRDEGHQMLAGVPHYCPMCKPETTVLFYGCRIQPFLFRADKRGCYILTPVMELKYLIAFVCVVQT
jgi:hypothetical protein